MVKSKSRRLKSQNGKQEWSPLLRYTRIFLQTILAIASLLSISYTHSFGLWEQDVWWQLRAGDELWSTWTFPQVDTWSYTVPGSEWKNVWWLSTLVLSVAYRLGGAAGLVILRSFLAMLFTAGLSSSDFLNPLSILLAICGTLAATFRIQIRPEMFVLALYSFIPLTQYSETVLVLFVFLTANTHYGMVPFAVAISSSLIAGKHGAFSRKTWKWAPLVLIASVACPHPIFGVKFVLHHSFGYNTDKLLSNPDMLSLADEPKTDCVYVYCGLVLLSIITSLFLSSKQLPVGYRDKLVVFGTHAMFVGLTIERSRVIPFHVLYMMPILVSLTSVFVSIGKHVKFIVMFILPCVLVFLVSQFNSKSGGSVLGISERVVWPVHSVEFAREHRIAPNLYHTFDFGNYIVYHLPEYKVFGDTRETIFKSVEAIYFKAFGNPVVHKQLRETYNVSSIITKIPDTQIRSNGWVNIFTDYFNPSEWAVVYFDDHSQVILKNVPDNRETIEKYRYTLLWPNLPHDHYVRYALHSPESDAIFEKELAQCLNQKFIPLLCRLADIAWRGSGHDPKFNPRHEMLRLYELDQERSLHGYKTLWIQGMLDEFSHLSKMQGRTKQYQQTHDEL